MIRSFVDKLRDVIGLPAAHKQKQRRKSRHSTAPGPACQ
jgi:hypothetical protein